MTTATLRRKPQGASPIADPRPVAHAFGVFCGIDLAARIERAEAQLIAACSEAARD